MTHVVFTRKTGASPHDAAELTLLTPDEYRRRAGGLPIPIPLETVTPDQAAEQVAFFLREHLDGETLGRVLARLSPANPLPSPSTT